MNEYEAKQEERRERAFARAARLKAEWEQKDKSARTRFPGSFVAGPANYPVRQHEKAHEAAHRAYTEWQQAEKAAQSVGTSNAISSDDPDAIDKLQRKLDGMVESQEKMKTGNAVIRKHKTDEARREALVNAGFGDRLINNMLTPDFMGNIGFPSWMLSNNNANIKRTEARIAQLGSMESRPAVEVEAAGYTYKEDAEENRAMFFFEGKPDEATRAILKRNAFKWSPSRGAWVRQLTNNAVWAARQVRDELARLSNNTP